MVIRRGIAGKSILDEATSFADREAVAHIAAIYTTGAVLCLPQPLQTMTGVSAIPWQAPLGDLDSTHWHGAKIMSAIGAHGIQLIW
jgi:hypothetical protein